ncbi:MAG: hypothetical protein Q7T80_02625 [Methanoregula sp.]|nr:hypothetical protein [Methanoregula sp.]
MTLIVINFARALLVQSHTSAEERGFWESERYRKARAPFIPLRPGGCPDLACSGSREPVSVGRLAIERYRDGHRAGQVPDDLGKCKVP